MRIPEYHSHDRNRKCNISYIDPDFRKYYDLDKVLFQNLVTRIQRGEVLNDRDNDLYGMSIITICLIVLEHIQFRKKAKSVKEKMLDEMYLKVVDKIRNFNPAKGAIYSYAYRLAYTSAANYFNDLIRDQKNQKKLDQHIRSCVEEYLDDVSDHRVGDRSAPVSNIWY
jgi:hypothetical protein